MTARRAIAVLLLAVIGAGCPENAVDLERMRRQRKVLPFTDMRAPPEGTVAMDTPLGQPLVNEGRANGAYAERIPIPLSRELVVRGRERFGIACAACHGERGDGDSEVAESMELRRPPNLLAPPVRGFPPGRIFDVITNGYGLMPSYRALLAIEDRWAVVAYLGALQLSQEVPLDALPPDVRARAEQVLP